MRYIPTIFSFFLLFTPAVLAVEQTENVPQVNFSTEERAWIEDHPVLRVANEDDWPPFDFSVNGEAKGFSIDLIKLVAQKIGVRLDFINGFTWDELQEKARARELEILTSIIKTPKRAGQYLFTAPYIQSPTVIVALKENNAISGLKDLFGKTVGVVKGYYQDEYLRDYFPQIHRLQVPSVLDGLKAVSYGRADAYIGSLAVANYEINGALISNLKIVGESGVSQIDSLDLRFAVHKDDLVLRGILQKGLDAVTPEEKLRLQIRWAMIPGESKERAAPLKDITPEELAWLKAHPKIRVHNETDWPPFNYFENGNPRGLSIDYMNLVARKLGVRFEYVSGPSWNEFLNMMKKKELDVMLNIVKTEDRQKYILYTEPYALNPNVIVSRKENRYEAVEDLFGKTVAFPKGFFYEEVLTRQYPQIIRLPVLNTLESLKSVSFGKADAALGESAVFHYLINKHLLTDLAVSGEVDIGNPDYVNLRIGIRDDWNMLQGIMIKAMSAVSMKEMNQLRQKWLFTGAESRKKNVLLTKDEKDWLAAHKNCRLGIDPLWPPFEFIDATKVYKGISSDYIRILNKKLNIDMQPVPGLGWSEVMDKARIGEIDVLPCLVKTPERSKFLLFTKPYLSYGMVILTRDGAPFVNGVRDFDSGRVAVIKGYVTQEFLERDYPDFRFHLANNVEDALLDVSRGKLDAFVGNIAVINYKTEELGLTNLETAATMPYTYDLAFAVRKDWPEFVNILDKQLAAISEEEKSRIKSFWTNIRVERQMDWRKVGTWGAVFFVLAAAIVGVVLWWNRRLAQEVTKRGRAEKALKKAKESAETANRAKSIFLANMSHELRTPLSTILGFSKLVANNPEIPAEERDYLRIIQRSGDYLLTLINQVLDLSKIEAGRITLNKKDFDLYRLLNDLEDLFSLKAEKKGLQLLFERKEPLPRYIRTDEIKLRQVLINLLGNALKFTEEGGITVRIETGRLNTEDLNEESDHRSSTVNLRFSVSDTGPGIASKDMDKVFEDFVQTEVGRQVQEGTGLGLSISRKFVQLMGGDMRVESEVGHGTEFTFDIRARTVDAVDKDGVGSTRRVIGLEPGQPRYRMLVVDDKPENRKLLVTLLSPFDFDLLEAPNGREAIDIRADWGPHLIWMDIRMPVLDGYKATKAIRNSEGENSKSRGDGFPIKTKIIAVTASSFEEENAVMLSAGCDDFLRKPFTDGEVFEILRKHLGIRFVYGEEQSAKSAVPNEIQCKLSAEENKLLTARSLAELPAELLETLKSAAYNANLLLLSNTIEEIRVRDAMLADTLACLTEDFEYDEILSLIQRGVPA